MQTQKKCAYCGQSGKSKEHIFPTWLLKKTPGYDLKFSRRKQKFHHNENLVYDVCRDCNNGPLSNLEHVPPELTR
jgi:hypothetical protein